MIAMGTVGIHNYYFCPNLLFNTKNPNFLITSPDKIGNHDPPIMQTVP